MKDLNASELRRLDDVYNPRRTPLEHDIPRRFRLAAQRALQENKVTLKAFETLVTANLHLIEYIGDLEKRIERLENPRTIDPSDPLEELG